MTISVIDDQSEIRYSVGKILKNQNHLVHKFNGKEEDLVELIAESGSNLIILDVMLETNKTGIDLLKEFKESGIKTPVILMTAYTTPENIIEASKYGVVDILQKPFDEDELIEMTNKYLVDKKQLSTKIEQLKEKKFIGSFETMQNIYKKIGISANNNLTVLISGKTGTGKELIAELIHKNSSRKNSPFIAVNCASIPDDLFESQLFGHEKGAFTSADSQHIGYAEQTKDGTLFLDEIGELNMATQSKLLRFLENHKFRRVGGNKEITFKGRIISATNINIQEYIEKNIFREDLFFRLSMISINLPSLNERKKDIPLLVEYFIGLANKELNTEIKSISKDALELLKNFQWTGNIRQLKNCIFNACLNATQNTIQTNDLTSLHVESANEDNLDIKQALKKYIQERGVENLKDIQEDIEKKFLSIAAKECPNLSKLSEFLGTSRLTLRKKLIKLNINYKETK